MKAIIDPEGGYNVLLETKEEAEYLLRSSMLGTRCPFFCRKCGIFSDSPKRTQECAQCKKLMQKVSRLLDEECLRYGGPWDQ
jgi:hypothetical protein